jgi:hypothetical protein
MYDVDDERPLRIGGRLRGALVADLVIDDPSPDVDWLLAERMGEHEWIGHLGRQLGCNQGLRWGTRETLRFLVGELEAELRKTWPPLQDQKAVQALAHEAVKNMEPIEVYGMLLDGPGQWRRNQQLAECRVEKLEAQLRRALEKALAAELRSLIDRWVEWDVRDVAKRRREAMDRAQAEARTLAVAARPPMKPGGLGSRSDRRDFGGHYQPPGRT